MGIYRGYSPIVENQLENKQENAMETATPARHSSHLSFVASKN